MISINWKGVYPAVTTKLKDDLSLDFDGFTKNIAAQQDAGVDGIILGGTLGESSTLINSEKSALIKARTISASYNFSLYSLMSCPGGISKSLYISIGILEFLITGDKNLLIAIHCYSSSGAAKK